MVPWTHRSLPANGISIGSSVFAGLTVRPIDTSRQAMQEAYATLAVITHKLVCFVQKVFNIMTEVINQVTRAGVRIFYLTL